ncbi:MAG: restriction endonuclease subunit S [Flavobacteriaceae bacterium]|nr:restriction endonuclease subunit S [Flavobacteriaceae bacterium]
MKHLLKHFKDLTVNPKNAQELKGLILQLAVQGKLTRKWRKENPDVESSSILLERIKAEKEELMRNKSIKRPRGESVIYKSEYQSVSPKEWRQIKLIDAGFTTKLAGFENTKYIRLADSGEVPVIMARNIGKNKIKEKIVKYINLDVSLILERSALTKPCVLITSIGAGIGDVAIFDKKERWHLAANTAKLELFNNLNTNLDFQYVVFYLLSYSGQKEIFKSVTTTAQPSLSTKAIRDIILELPPLEEQKEIVKVVETLFKEVEQLEQLTVKRISLKEKFAASALNQLTTNNAKKEWAFLQDHFAMFFNETTNIKKLRETVLQLAVQGKLTKTNEPYSECIGNIIQFTKNGFTGRPNDAEIGLKRLGIETVTQTSFIKLNEALAKYIEVPENKKENYFVKNQDVFICRQNGNLNFVGKAAVYYGDDDKLIFSDSLIQVRPLYKIIDSSYLAIFINSKTARYQLDKFCSTTAGNFSINGTNLKKVVVPIFSLEEQKAIVQKVNALIGFCDELEQVVQQSQEQSEQLMQSCLKEVFN